jgi:hypothetical protein
MRKKNKKAEKLYRELEARLGRRLRTTTWPGLSE